MLLFTTRVSTCLWVLYLGLHTRTGNHEQEDPRRSCWENQQPRWSPRDFSVTCSQASSEQLSSAPLALWTWPLLTKTEWREMAPCQCLRHIWTNEEQRRASEQRREVLVWSRVSSLGQSHQGWLAACLSLQTSPFEGKSFPTRDHYLVAEMAPWWSRIVECRTSEHAAQAPGGDVPTMGTQHPWDLHVGMMSTVISEFWIFCQGRVCS